MFNAFMLCYLFFMSWTLCFLRRPRVSVSKWAQGWVGRYMEKDKGRGSVQVGGCGVLVIHFFGVYAPLAKRFSLPIRRVRGREARFVDSLFFATPKSKRVLMHARRYTVLTRCTLGLPRYLFFLSWTICFLRRPRVSVS